MNEHGDNDAAEDVVLQQRLKAAIHYTVGHICKSLEEELEVTFSKHVIAVITEALFKQTGTFASDLENFCQHAKRKAVNADDVKLLARRSGTLAQHIRKFHKRIKERDDAVKKKNPKKSATTSTVGD